MVDTASAGTELYVDTTVDILSYQGPRGVGIINGNWDPPRARNDRFAVVYHGWFKPNKTGDYAFRTRTDDSHEFMIKGLGYTNDIITKHYGWNTWNTRTNVTLDKNTWYEFELRIQNYGGEGGAQFQYRIPNSNTFNQLGGNNGNSHPLGEWSATDPNADPITADGYIKGAEEQGLAGITVSLLTQNKGQPGFSYTTADTTVTDSNGYYSFNTTINYNDYDFTINIAPQNNVGLPTVADINWFCDRILTGPVSSKDYWRMDVNNSGSFSVADIYAMHQRRHGNLSSYPGSGQTLWTTNYHQQPYVWDAVSVDTNDKTLIPGYGAWSLFDLANGNSTTFYVIKAGHKN
tara:strand:+ start:761 stop:1801 length:1041 start_codon:yes stop_codon:yes gene_type:complete